MKNDTIKVTQWGLVCDNQDCDWRDDTIKLKDYKKWLNKPCPKCGMNLLTQHDMDNAVVLSEVIKLTNRLNGYFGIEVDHSNDKKIIVNTHKVITFRVEDL